MANKAISELPQAQNVNNQDLFVLEQSGIAKKLPAETFITEQGIINALAEALDGHGGIQSVTLSSVSGRIRTYLITFTDGSATTFQVYDGTSIDRISRTSSSGLDDVYTIFLSDGTTTFFTVHNGADGTVSEAMLNDALKNKAPVITETTESSAIANFTDGADDMVMHNVVAEINPVQDLTYGDPYPAGSGKNKLSLSSISLGGDEPRTKRIAIEPIAAGTYKMSGVNTGTATTDIGFQFYDAISGGTNVGNGYLGGTLTLTGEAVSVYCYMSTADYNNGKTVIIGNMQIEAGNSITDYAPYSNICPISGHTEVNVTRTGKNLLPNNFYGGVPYNASAGTPVTPTLLTDVVQTGNTYTKAVNSWGSISMISAPLPLGTYKLSIAVTATSTRSSLYVMDGNYKITRRIANSSVPIQWTNAITLNPGEKYIAIYLGSNSAGTVTFTAPQIESGTTITAYEEYVVPATITVDWTTEAGTVYGGTIDVATGLLTVDKGIVTLDGTENWSGSGGEYYTSKHDMLRTNDYVSLITCDKLTTVTRASVSSTDYHITGYSGSSYQGQNWIYVRINSTVTTGAECKAWITANPTTVVYPLATPQTYQLTGQQLKTLLGTNNVWADTGDTSVTYPADTKMFIEKLTIPTEDDMVANQAITSGKYFMVGNSLYLALANIASGAQITIGTNAQRVSLADALNTINS